MGLSDALLEKVVLNQNTRQRIGPIRKVIIVASVFAFAVGMSLIVLVIVGLEFLIALHGPTALVRPLTNLMVAIGIIMGALMFAGLVAIVTAATRLHPS